MMAPNQFNKFKHLFIPYGMPYMTYTDILNLRSQSTEAIPRLIGTLTPEERREKVEKYREKKKNRAQK